MVGLIEAATAVMQSAEHRLEVTSRNVANVSTAGYKQQSLFSQIKPSNQRAESVVPTTQTIIKAEQGKLESTGNPLDFAISGHGYFAIRAGDRIWYTRQGQFKLSADGTVVNEQGFALQQAGGGDLILDHTSIQIGPDGTIVDDGRPVGRIALYQASDSSIDTVDGSLFHLGPEVDEIATPLVRQGMIEASNVSVGDEMVTMMAAIRESEGGARLAQTYDDLLGKAFTAFGQSGR